MALTQTALRALLLAKLFNGWNGAVLRRCDPSVRLDFQTLVINVGVYVLISPSSLQTNAWTEGTRTGLVLDRLWNASRTWIIFVFGQALNWLWVCNSLISFFLVEFTEFSKSSFIKLDRQDFRWALWLLIDRRKATFLDTLLLVCLIVDVERKLDFAGVVKWWTCNFLTDEACLHDSLVRILSETMSELRWA